MAYSSPPTDDAYISSHYTIGLLTALIAIIVLILSALTRRFSFVATSIVAVIVVAVADEAGITFWSHGQDEIYSIIMGIAFLIAFTSYLGEALIITRTPMPKPAVS